ncbi:MAG: ankyrin repeat domain-containing protein [Saprospiraceae bacterium]|nr:ankyrin repeat domain-containing protein [Saprospiraceae bacterium]
MYYNNFHVTQFLINQQIHIDNVNNFGCTPLMIASSKGNSDIVNILLKNNANTEIQLPDGSNAAIIAEVFKYPNIAENINFAAKTNHHIEKMSTNDIEKLIKTTFTATDFIDLFENIFIPDER